MAWCPKCKNEYIESIKICPKCSIDLCEKDIALSAIYDEENDTITFANEEDDNAFNFEATKFHERVNSSSFMGGKDFSYDAEEITKLEYDELDKLSEAAGQVSVGGRKKSNRYSDSPIYQNKKEKAEDVKSSAISLIIVGVVGLTIISLVFTDVIKLNQTMFGKIVTCSVMGVLFISLIIMGILSVKSFKVLRKNATEEDKMTEEIEKWYKEQLTKNQIEDRLFTDEEQSMSDEEKYFKRMAKILQLLNESFVNLEATYAEHMAEEIYAHVYENED